ncbi:MAG TPA: YbhB/YbcL family Raf kinase inhibitor-like protein [Balneolaceae bacterium]
MTIKSVFENNHEIPRLHTCLGANISPPFTFEDIPEGTKSLVLIVEDMNATPAPWTHWLVFNISPNTKTVEEDHIPAGGTEGLANNHSFGYEGPCPKYFEGTHHYRFSLFALDMQLDLVARSEKDDVKKAMQGHVIEETTLIGLCTSA